MRPITIVATTVLATLMAGAVGAAVFVGSGIYNIGADDHHTKPVFALIQSLRERSIEVRDRELRVPNLQDPASIQAGAIAYAARCTVCHLAPGMGRSEVRTGMYPHPPNLAQEGIYDPKEAFWIVKHGIKMSAMPSWSKSLDDPAIWDVVAFLHAVPDMTPEKYQQLTGKHD
jgi:mono/diheme cytochrome c family protein